MFVLKNLFCVEKLLNTSKKFKLAGAFGALNYKFLFKISCISLVAALATASSSWANITSKTYVDRIVANSGFEKTTNKVTTITSTSTDAQYPSAKAVYTHTSNISNPHGVTATQVGLGNVKNVDQTNASNLTSGTVAYPRLPTGTAANTVAAGDDGRFWAVPNSAYGGSLPAGWSAIWIEP